MILILFVLGFHSSFLLSQPADSLIIENLFTSALRSTLPDKNLEKLCTEAPHRLAGSVGSAKAIEKLLTTPDCLRK